MSIIINDINMFIIIHMCLVGKKLPETSRQIAHDLLCFFSPSIELNSGPLHTHCKEKACKRSSSKSFAFKSASYSKGKSSFYVLSIDKNFYNILSML